MRREIGPHTAMVSDHGNTGARILLLHAGSHERGLVLVRAAG